MEKPSYKRIEIHKLFDKSDELFEFHITSLELRRHSIAVGVIMRFLAKELGFDQDEWTICGKLHDLDYSETKNKPEEHGRLTVARLTKYNYPLELRHAILSHNEEYTGVKRENPFDYCLAAADNVSGLINAYALLRKDLSGMEVKGLKKKLGEGSFASGINRSKILEIEKVMPLDKFLEIAIKAMQSISKELGFS
jgi:uncharacterized protein